MIRTTTSTDRTRRTQLLQLANVEPAGGAMALTAFAGVVGSGARPWMVCSTVFAKSNLISRDVADAKHAVQRPKNTEKGFSREVRGWS